MIGFGLVNNWETLIGLRLVLGIFEAGFFPGVVYLLSTWYRRYEVGKRYAIFYMIGCLASAFGGILAFGLMQMVGVAGYGLQLSNHKQWSFATLPNGDLMCILKGPTTGSKKTEVHVLSKSSNYKNW